MKRKTVGRAAGLLLAASLAMTGCTYSVRVGDKEFTNKKETAAASEEGTESIKDETTAEAAARETEPETTAVAKETAAWAGEHGTFEIPLSDTASIFYGGPYDLHLDGKGGEVDYQNGDSKLAVQLVDDSTALSMALGFAAIKDPRALDAQYEGIVDSALDSPDGYADRITEIRGYAWDGNSDTNVNLDAIYFEVEQDGTEAASLLVFTGSDQNIMVAYTKETGIPVESIGIAARASGKELWVADAEEVDLGLWLRAMAAKLEEAAASGIADPDAEPVGVEAVSSTAIQYDGRGNLTFTSGSGASYPFAIPDGYAEGYRSEDVITFDWAPEWGNTIGFWGFEYTPYSEDVKVTSSMPYDCYMHSSEFTDTYSYPIDGSFYIRIEIHKEEGQDKDTLAEADALLMGLFK
ncbi:MAG: hypothetical protein NC489_36235 [Ruminococcus flavefaciens]|nr:hypothetical protein [Ruminococcus flavefaciens]